MTEEEDVEEVEMGECEADWFLTHDGIIIFPYEVAYFAEQVGAAMIRIKTAKMGTVECLMLGTDGNLHWRDVTNLKHSDNVVSLVGKGESNKGKT